MLDHHPEALVAFVKETGRPDCFDGDGDRCIAVDENGEIVDGDKIMFILGKHFQPRNAKQRYNRINC